MPKPFNRKIRWYRSRLKLFARVFLCGSLLLGAGGFVIPVTGAAGDAVKPGAKFIEIKPGGSDSPTTAGLIKLAVIACTEATIIPTAGSIEWYKADIPRIIHQEIQAYYPDNKFLVMADAEIAAALNKNGYDLNALEMPDKEDIIKLAAALNADAILAMELSNLGVTAGSTAYKYHTIARYRAYQVNNNRFVLRRFLYEGVAFSNKAAPKVQKDQLVDTITATVDLILAGCCFGDNWK